MKNFSKIRVYAWIEFAIWMIIVAVCVLGLRYHNYQKQKDFKNYQIFIEDVDGLIVGSPVRFLGVQIGYVKKIQILSTEVYVKFVLTQEGLELPIGSVATVEASGLGGSKSLEIYPPNQDIPTDKLISVKEPTRLNKVIGLFDSIFRELDAIIVTIHHTAEQFDSKKGGVDVPKNIVTPADGIKDFESINKQLDGVIEQEHKFMKMFKKEK